MKMNISRLFPYKCIRNQRGTCIKGLFGLLVPERKIFKGVLPYMGVVAILVM